MILKFQLENKEQSIKGWFLYQLIGAINFE